MEFHKLHSTARLLNANSSLCLVDLSINLSDSSWLRQFAHQILAEGGLVWFDEQLYECRWYLDHVFYGLMYHCVLNPSGSVLRMNYACHPSFKFVTCAN